jgi:predicted nucleic acid-binding protein
VSVLVDTNVLLRLAQPNHRQYPAAIDGVVRARLAGETLYVTPQNNAEFWAAATRPVGAANGLGLTATAAAGEIATIERLFQLAADDPAIHPIWKGLVITHRVLGTQVYDARLVAAMLAHGIDRILTFNVADFSRYGVTVLHPAAGP